MRPCTGSLEAQCGVGILDDAIVGTIFIGRTLNDGMYLEIVENIIGTLITEQLQNPRLKKSNVGRITNTMESL